MGALKDSLLIVIKQRLKAAGITQQKLAKDLGMSLPSIKRLFSGKPFTLERIEKIAETLKVSVSDLIREADGNISKVPYKLTKEQESLLASDYRLYAFFFSLIHRIPIDRIMSRFKISRLQVEKYLLQLNKVGIIELREKLKFRILISSEIRWQKGGPIEREIVLPTIRFFLERRKRQSPDTIYEFFVAKFTPELYAEFSRKVRELSETMFRRAASEEVLQPNSKSVAFAVLLETFSGSMLSILQHKDNGR